MAIQVDTDAKVLGETWLGFGQQRTVRISTGRIFITHVTDLDEVEVHYSDDGGATWVLDTTISSLTSPTSVCLAVDEIDDVFLSTVHGAGTSYNVLINKKDGTTGAWSIVKNEPITLVANGPPFRGLLSYRAGKLIFLYLPLLTGGTVYRRYFISNDKGGTWNAVALGSPMISNTGFNVESTVLGVDVDSTGYAYVFWAVYNLGLSAYELHGIEKIDFGGYTYSTVASFPFSGKSTNSGALTVDVNDNAWTARYSLESGNYWLRVYKNATENLVVDYLAVDSLVNGMISMGTDGVGNVFLFYTKRTDNKCYYRKYNVTSAIWESEIVYSTGTGLRPSIEQHISTGASKLNVAYITDVI